MGVDLTAVAQGNSATRQAEASDALAKDGSGQLSRFRDFAADTTFSTNVDFEKVYTYDKASGILDTRSYFIQQSGGIDTLGLERFEREQGSMLAPRQAFEDLWEGGRHLVYGAVNGGGMGVEDFGPICLVVPRPDASNPDVLAVFPADTAQRYADATGRVDTTLANSEATAWDDREELAVVILGGDAVVLAEADWPLLLCSNNGYLEVVRAGTLDTGMITEVRLRTALRTRLEDLRARWLAGESLTPVERNEAAAYDALHRWRRAHGTTIEDVT